MLQKLIAAVLVLLVVAYEIGPSRWIHEGLGVNHHLLAEIVIYGTLGPLLAFLLLEFLGRWLDEHDTTDLQARVLTEAHEQARACRELADHALQTLFATSALLITSLISTAPDLPPDTAAAFDQTEQALHRAIQHIRDHLENNSSVL